MEKVAGGFKWNLAMKSIGFDFFQIKVENEYFGL